MKLQWPRKTETITRTRLLEMAVEFLNETIRQEVGDRQRYERELAEWRATIQQRLIDYIPELENLHSWNPGAFQAPYKPYAGSSDRLRSTIFILEHLDTEVIGPEFLQAIRGMGLPITYD